VATSLADPPARAAGKDPAAPSAPPPAGADGLGAQPRVCAKCGAPMASGQDWCFQCGAGAPGSLDTHAHRWRSGAAVLSAVALLIAGAAVAAYAALSKSNAKPRPALAALAQAPAAAASPPAAVTPPTGSVTPPPTTPKLGAPSVKPPVPLPKPPKVPRTTAAPKPAATTAPSTTGATTTPAAGQKTPAGTGGTNTTQKQPTALLLDTNAASTYNPYAYPASNFGDPSLAIDGEKSTAWTALVDPAVAPKMAEGLVIDLKTAQKVSALALTSAKPGMTVQVYGATGSAPPASITDPAWAPLSRLVVDDKRYRRIPLGHSKQAFRFVALWISKAPASAVGRPRAPGHVKVNELELFPAR